MNFKFNLLLLLLIVFESNSNTKTVLVGSPVHQKPNILKEFLISLTELTTDNLILDFYFVDDNENLESKKMLQEFQQAYPHKCLIQVNNREIEHFECNEITHHWPDRTVWKVAGFKNKIIEYAKSRNYDYIFLIDSDLVLHPNTVNHLIETGKDIISEIFWTSWTPGQPMLPQVWLYDFYTQHEVIPGKQSTEDDIKKSHAQFINQLKKPGVYEIGGLGACTLISKNALNMGVNFNKIKNLTFWGEDRHFCIRACALGLSLYVDTHYPAYHIYRESYLSGVKDYKETNKYIN